jgi:1-aminocyclopropane-1-carboxylate deaminase
VFTLDYISTPVEEISTPMTVARGVRLLIKREYLNHAEISGNKWWKLKYNLQAAVGAGFSTVLTFGGAYSNHIYSTASAAAHVNLQSIGVIRGEPTSPLNPTLSFALSKGMRLHYVSRTDYRAKTEPAFVSHLRSLFGDFFLIPEGGSNVHAVRGCKEFGELLVGEMDFDTLFLPVGTGGTIAGLIAAMRGKKKIIGVPVFRDSEFLYDDIRRLLRESGEHDPGNWTLLSGYDHGGYAKTTPQLTDLIKTVRCDLGLPLEQVYTGKMMWAVFEEIRKGNVVPGSKVLAVHTGGLQGMSATLS